MPLIVSALDWTQIIVAGISALGACISAGIGASVLWHVRAPSGRKIGELVEETHSITAGQVVEQLGRIEANGHGVGDTREDAA